MDTEKILDQLKEKSRQDKSKNNTISYKNAEEITDLCLWCDWCENVWELTSPEICRACEERKRLIELCKEHKIDVVIEE